LEFLAAVPGIWRCHRGWSQQASKKPLADAILFGELKDGGTAKMERKGDGVGIVVKVK
jgi:hypothetical protein